MTDLILVVQSGDRGPVRLVACTTRTMRRTLEVLQRGNPDLLHVRDAVSGDQRTERRLHQTIDAHYAARDWYEPAALQAIPATFLRHDYDREAERQRIAGLKLDEILRAA